MGWCANHKATACNLFGIVALVASNDLIPHVSVTKSRKNLPVSVALLCFLDSKSQGIFVA
jgi:hypothetical protein